MCTEYLHLEHAASNIHHHANCEGVLILALMDCQPICMTKAHSVCNGHMWAEPVHMHQ